MDNINKYLTDSLETLNTRPESIEEISESKKIMDEIRDDQNSYKDIYNRIKEKNKVLRAIAGAGFNLSQIDSRWDNLLVSVDGFNQLINEQKEHIKSQIQNKIKNINANLEKFVARWKALRPKERDMIDLDAVENMSLKMKDWF